MEHAPSGGSYPASDASELDHVASTIKLRLTITSQRLPLAGAFIALALVLLAAGAVLTVVRSGRAVWMSLSWPWALLAPLAIPPAVAGWWWTRRPPRPGAGRRASNPPAPAAP